MHTDENYDTGDILKELNGLESEYYLLGTHLHLPPSKVKEIRANNPRHCKTALCEVVTEWLELNYDYNKFGMPTWVMLVEAVRELDIEQARKIANKHKVMFIKTLIKSLCETSYQIIPTEYNRY